jgi:predicted Holliday junction resolvase-like endonuclease
MKAKKLKRNNTIETKLKQEAQWKRERMENIRNRREIRRRQETKKRRNEIEEQTTEAREDKHKQLNTGITEKHGC